jgi:hypothetical protein
MDTILFILYKWIINLSLEYNKKTNQQNLNFFSLF